MSLTTMIQYDDKWKLFFRENIPKKNEFKTVSGHTAFSKEYEELAKYSLSNRHYSSVVGTAFDYIARWIVAKNVSVNKEMSCENLIAESGLYACSYVAREKKINLEKKYDDAMHICRQFIAGYASKNDVIKVAIFFAKLEHAYRMVARPFDIDIDYILGCEEEIEADLEQLCNVFEEKFIFSGLVTNESRVVYNPTFGGASIICGGADADIYIDGTLYDFKCTKKHGYVWNEVSQILGYYFLDQISKKNNDEDNGLNGYEINRIAFYRARFGEIEYIDISKIQYQCLIDSFEQILGKENYQKYFEEKRKRKIEEEQREREKLEKELKERRELEEIIKRGDKDEIMLCKMKQISGYGDYFDEKIKQCKNEKERKREIKWLVEANYNTRMYRKIDSKKIKQVMQREKITVEELSNRVDRTQATVKKWVEGKSIPTLGTFINLLDILKCTKEDILL